MKKKIYLLPAIILCVIMSGCGQSPKSSSTEEQKEEKEKKVLIAYYSHSGNTKAMANQIHEIAGGDLFEIIPVTAYPTDHAECVERGRKEIEEGFKPKLQTKIDNIASYDIIFVGSPNWCSTIAPPVTAFLSEYDLSGKTVIPFCTHGRGGLANCFIDMEKLCPNSTMLKGLALPGNQVDSSKVEVEKWLTEIEMAKKSL